ncbi:MAG: chemotaxis protein, partial [Clostridium sp.]
MGKMERGNRLNVKLALMLCFVLVGQSYLLFGFARGTRALLCGILVIVLTLLIEKKSKNLILSGIGIPGSVMLAELIFVIIYKGTGYSIMAFLGTLIMCALYFNERLILIYSAIMNSLILLIQIILGFDLLGETHSFQNFVTQFSIVITTEITLYFLVKWGNEALAKVAESESDLKSALIKLEENTKNIFKQVDLLNGSSKNTKNQSKCITKSMEEITLGIEEQ